MKRVMKVYNDSYEVFKKRFEPNGSALNAVNTWKRLNDIYSRELEVVVQGLEEALCLLQESESENHLDSTRRLFERLCCVNDEAREVIHAQMGALRRAWSDVYSIVARDGDTVMTTDMYIGVAVQGTIRTVDDVVSGNVLCVMEPFDGGVYPGAPVRAGAVAGYKRRGGLSSTPNGRVRGIHHSNLRVLRPKVL